MTEILESRIAAFLRSVEGVRAAWIFGSVAEGTEDASSDLDVAVLGETPFSAETKKKLIETLARITGRPVDLIDLQTTHGSIVRRVLRDGSKLFCEDTTLHAELLQRQWLHEADWMPYHRRILDERRKQWMRS